MNKFQEMVRARLRERLKDKDDDNFTTLAIWLKRDPSTIQKRLRPGGTALRLDWLDEVRSFFQMSVSEMVREPGDVFQSVSPLEASLLDRFRRMSETQRLSLMNVLDWRPQVYQIGKRSPRYTGDDALVVSLYNRSADNVKTAVLEMMQKHPLLKDRPAPTRGKFLGT